MKIKIELDTYSGATNEEIIKETILILKDLVQDKQTETNHYISGEYVELTYTITKR